jgi:hypothetical protein
MASRRTGKKGGQYGNRNAIKHGGYLNLYDPDQRTREAKILNHIEASLVSAIGNNPTPQEILLIKRTSVKGLRCAALEREIIQQKNNVSPELERKYLRWASELRTDLKLLGLERRQKQVTTDLEAYIEKKYN